MPANGTALCNNGQCSYSCNPGFHACGGQCLAVDSPLACGAACLVCPAATSCVQGTCTASPSDGGADAHPPDGADGGLDVDGDGAALEADAPNRDAVADAPNQDAVADAPHEDAVAEDSAPTGVCSGKPIGSYCGSDLGIEPATALFECTGSPSPELTRSCEEGCRADSVAGNDDCYEADCTGVWDGYYCGTDQVHGNPQALYLCMSGSAVSYQTCPNDCLTQSAGIDDVCAGDLADPPSHVRAAPGNGFVELRWNPTSIPSTGFTITVHPGAATWSAPPGARRLKLTNLVNGIAYRFTVAADSGNGSSPSAPVTPSPQANVIIDVPFYSQLQNLTCEEASLRMALEHAGVVKAEATILNDIGIDLTPSYIDGNGALHWGNPYTSYVGDPNGSEAAMTGYGTYYPTIASVATSYGVTVVDSGEQLTPSTLYGHLLNDHPIVAWVTSDWNFHAASMVWIAFDNTQLEWHGPHEHAVTLVGVTDTDVLVDNPAQAEEWQWISKAQFESTYETYNEMAVVIQ